MFDSCSLTLFQIMCLVTLTIWLLCSIFRRSFNYRGLWLLLQQCIFLTILSNLREHTKMSPEVTQHICKRIFEIDTRLKLHSPSCQVCVKLTYQRMHLKAFCVTIYIEPCVFKYTARIQISVYSFVNVWSIWCAYEKALLLYTRTPNV